MRLDTRAFGLAAGATAAVLFTVCAFFVAVAPLATTAFFGTLIHADLSSITRTLTFASFVVGLCAWAVGVGLSFMLAAAIYNRLVGGATATRPAQHPAAGRV